ncbi:MAG: hypothetical protein AAGA90_03915 [Actinomycetota bacterium]
MTTTSPAPQTTAPARSLLIPGLVLAAVAIAALVFVWFRPSAQDQARLDVLEADPTLVLPMLDGEVPELLGSESSVASRSWSGEWSITERTDRYALQSRRVDRYAVDLYDHITASSWDVTSVQCQEDQVVITGRQVVDGDWATLEFTAWATGPSGQLSVRSAVSAVGGNDLMVVAETTEARINCPALN